MFNYPNTNEEKGFTTIELLISMVVLMIVFVASFQFFESYDATSSDLGEYESAKYLAINGIENVRAQINIGDNSTGEVYAHETHANRIQFYTTVLKENVTTDFAFFDNRIELFKLTSTVSWKDKTTEVKTYVSGR